MKIQKKSTKLAALGLALLLAAGSLGSIAMAAPDAQSASQYEIANPYANVDWAAYGQYKAAYHTHSTFSDGSSTRTEMIETHYDKGFDILTMGEHDVTTRTWDTAPYGGGPGLSADMSRTGGLLSSERKAEIEAGVGRDGKGMINIEYSNEQSATDHLMTFWADFNNTARGSLSNWAKVLDTVQKAGEIGGISHINHPGRVLGNAYNTAFATAISRANNFDSFVNNYVDIFMAEPTLVGMEIINKIDGESLADRVLWDNILTQTMPQGRPVWGFSNDDAHSVNAVGYSWNTMLMPELSQAGTKTAMETGAFYTVSRVSRLDGINAYLPNGTTLTPGSGDTSTLYLLNQSTPSISNIVVSGNTIAITGADYSTVEWVSGVDANGNSKVIATGNSIDVSEYADAIANGYVRAQLKSSTGIAFTQPFGITEAAFTGASATASVNKLNGSQNDLTITVTEFYSNGNAAVITETIKISNNAADTYTVGSYQVYVDTKGNDQIRACYIVE